MLVLIGKETEVEDWISEARDSRRLERHETPASDELGTNATVELRVIDDATGSICFLICRAEWWSPERERAWPSVLLATLKQYWGGGHTPVLGYEFVNADEVSFAELAL